mmetsp:Transcript_16851/g.48416  ORF Transcript_16851/g.48416 Transcript_16851/m.48416 type:complete len:254 (+) Transcript_16851:604-1365(+)
MGRSGQDDVAVLRQSVEGWTELVPSDVKHLQQLGCGLEGRLRCRPECIGALGIAQPVNIFRYHFFFGLGTVTVSLTIHPKEQRGDRMDGIPDRRNNEALATLGQVKHVAVVGQRLAHGQMGYATPVRVDEVLKGPGVVRVVGKLDSHVIPAVERFELQMLDGVLAVVVLAIEGFDHRGQEGAGAALGLVDKPHLRAGILLGHYVVELVLEEGAKVPPIGPGREDVLITRRIGGGHSQQALVGGQLACVGVGVG